MSPDPKQNQHLPFETESKRLEADAACGIGEVRGPSNLALPFESSWGPFEKPCNDSTKTRSSESVVSPRETRRFSLVRILGFQKPIAASSSEHRWLEHTQAFGPINIDLTTMCAHHMSFDEVLPLCFTESNFRNRFPDGTVYFLTKCESDTATLTIRTSRKEQWNISLDYERCRLALTEHKPPRNRVYQLLMSSPVKLVAKIIAVFGGYFLCAIVVLKLLASVFPILQKITFSILGDPT